MSRFKTTENVLDDMLKKSNLSLLQRRKLKSCLKEKKSFPKNLNPPKPKGRIPVRRNLDGSNMFGKKSYNFKKKRKLDDMFRRDPGMYIAEQALPYRRPERSREAEKDRFIEILTDGKLNGKKKGKKGSKKKNTRKPTRKKKDRFSELVEEINERHQWLMDMQKLDPVAAKEHEGMIKSQISGKLREIKLLNEERTKKELNVILNKYTD